MQIRFNTLLRKYAFSNYKNYGSLTHHFKDDTLITNSQNPQLQYVDYFRKQGHLFTQLDPLHLIQNKSELPSPLDFGIKYSDNINSIQSLNSVEELENYLTKTYASTVGVQFDHIEDPQERQWLYDNYEKFMNLTLSPSEKINIQTLLVQSEAVDHFMHKKFTTFKRYSGEGGEATPIALKAIYAYASEKGVTNVVQSMAHRGRFPIMCTLLDYPPSEIFRKIMGYSDMPDEYTFGVCDVVHHLSTSNAKRYAGAGCKEKEIRVSVVHNPSHLEAANPVSQGKSKAKQDDYQNQEQVLNLQLHGDSAFVGQGIVYESLLLQNLDNYSIGGSVHIIQNNQIGYTTNIKDSRSTRYCSDSMLGFKYPIIHVNGEDVEAVHKIAKFVVEYRQQYKKDILIDLVTYRKYGHNEVDEPSFTQPNLYNKIRSSPSLPYLYNEQLVKQGLAKKEDYDRIRDKVFVHLDSEYEKAKSIKQTLAKITDDSSKGSKAFTQKWKGMKFSQFCSQNAVTGIEKKKLIDIAMQSVLIRPNFTVHPRLQKYFIEPRIKEVNDNQIDWATAEAMAIGSLLEEGYNVRLSGQDVERGTFSQRHFVFVDQKTEDRWIPLQSLAEAKLQGRLQVCNSPLSEAAVMAYDFGYGMENPQNLVIWEAQFGDFYNTGQSIVDTFISCAEEKWMRQSSLVMLLPHGFDGAGPEHSSCRMERFLQNGIQNQNFQFICPSTPSTVFHMLRRQMHREYRKPLIVASAKGLLRANYAKCKLEDLDVGTQFKPVLLHRKDKIEKVFVCYGKMVHELLIQLDEQKYENYAIIALEQLLPFPIKELESVLQQIPQSAKYYFVQEEPRNAGAYQYCQQYIPRDLHYVGRKESPSVAVGVGKQHSQEIQMIKDSINKLLL